VIIIDECPKNWGMRHDTMSALKVMLDNTECVMDIKKSHVPKRCWRWVLLSNYPPREVFQTAPSQNQGFAIDGELDRVGLYEPIYERIRRVGDNYVDGHVMQAVNEPGDYSRGCVVCSYNWMSGGLENDNRSLGGFVQRPVGTSVGNATRLPNGRLDLE